MSNTTVVGHVSKIEYKQLNNGGLWNVSIAENNSYGDNKYTIWYNFTFDSRTFPEDHPVLSRTKKGNVVEVIGVPPYKLDEYTSRTTLESDNPSLSLKLQGTFIQWRQIGRRDEENGDNAPSTGTRKPRDVSQFEEQEIA